MPTSVNDTATANDRIVAFANRLPVRRVAQGWRPAEGGLVAALRPALEAHRATWVGWNPGGGDVPRRIDGLDIELHAVALTRAEAEGSYHGFANRTLWPLLHSLVEQPVFEPRWWEATGPRTVASPTRTRRMRSPLGPRLPPALASEHASQPRGGRADRLLPPCSVPAARALREAALAWRVAQRPARRGRDLVPHGGVSGNFLRSCARVLDDVQIQGSKCVLPDGREVRTTVNPISIDASGLAEKAVAPAVDRHLARLRRRFEGRKVLLGVDRLDYTKGIPERLKAVELLLEIRPERRRDLSFVQIAVPSRGEIREYEDLRSTVEELVGRINGRFTGATHDVPVHYLYRGVTSEQLLAYYRLADVCLVTPLNDGMNLVAKEFVTVQGATAGEGVLVLSEFTGAIQELTDALPCNPFDIEGLAGSIELALELPTDDRVRRLRQMAKTVATYDIGSVVREPARGAGAIVTVSYWPVSGSSQPMRSMRNMAYAAIGWATVRFAHARVRGRAQRRFNR